MGSSILASLSEAGGNNPHRVVSKPLPPHSLRSADRFRSERDPQSQIEQVCGPNNGLTKKRYVAVTVTFNLKRIIEMPPLVAQIGNGYPGVGAGKFPIRMFSANYRYARRKDRFACVARETLRRFPNLKVSSGRNMGYACLGSYW
jgi:hypothetical protein